MINPRILVIVILFMGLSSILAADIIFAQNDSETDTIVNGTKTFDEFDVDMTFQYPAHWNVSKVEPYFLTIDVGKDIGFLINIESLDRFDPPITTLKDFARHQYDSVILALRISLMTTKRLLPVIIPRCKWNIHLRE